MNKIKCGHNIIKNISLLNSSTLQLISRRHYPEVRKRFYKNVTVAGTSNCYEVNLDQRKLKTPLGNLVQVPNYPLALAIASEWLSVDQNISPSTMHLTGLSFTALDNPQKLSESDKVQKIIDYLDTDTVLFKEPNEDLLKMQAEEWDPILDWFNDRFQLQVESSEGICAVGVTDEAKEKLKKYFLSYRNKWAISGILYGVEAIKSVILTTACLERRITPEKAIYLSLLETEFQTEKWGSFEWAHDVEKYDLLARFSASILFVQLNSSDYSRKQKLSLR